VPARFFTFIPWTQVIDNRKIPDGKIRLAIHLAPRLIPHIAHLSGQIT